MSSKLNLHDPIEQIKKFKGFKKNSSESDSSTQSDLSAKRKTKKMISRHTSVYDGKIIEQLKKFQKKTGMSKSSIYIASFLFFSDKLGIKEE